VETAEQNLVARSDLRLPSPRGGIKGEIQKIERALVFRQEIKSVWKREKSIGKPRQDIQSISIQLGSQRSMLAKKACRQKNAIRRPSGLRSRKRDPNKESGEFEDLGFASTKLYTRSKILRIRGRAPGGEGGVIKSRWCGECCAQCMNTVSERRGKMLFSSWERQVRTSGRCVYQRVESLRRGKGVRRQQNQKTRSPGER